MKVCINRCYGGFSLSKKAVKRMTELQGKECYFFKYDYNAKQYLPIEEDDDAWSWTAFTVPNPNDCDDNDLFYIEQRPEDRSNPILIQVVEELGRDADGDCAELKIVEIPDGVEYEISEYDGIERVEEVHNTWY